MSIFDDRQSREEDFEAGGVIKGVAVALVVQNKDDSGLGRLKVRLPYRENPDESYWARVVTPMAGNGYGLRFIPEIGDEVLVACEREDVRHLYVIGSLWNGKDKPPEANTDGQNDVRKIRSRGGHELIFDDNESSKAKVEIHTAGGHKILLDDSSGGEKILIADGKGANKIVIDSAKGAVSIESATTLSIKSSKIDIQASAMMTVKSGSMLTLEGTLVKIN